MPNTEDIQEAVDDLGAQLEATFAARAAAEMPSAGDDAPSEPVPAGDDEGQGDDRPAEGDATPPPSGEGDEDQPPDPEPSAGPTSPVEQWAATLPAEVREQFGQIEAGTHQAVDRREFEAYRQWQAQQAATGAQDAPTFDNLAPEQREYVRRLQDDYERLQSEHQSRLVQQQQSGLVELEQTVATVTKAYADRHGLDEHATQLLQDHTARMGLVGNLWEQGRTYNPVTGQLAAEPDPAAVFGRAFDLAMNDHPDLRQRALDRAVAERIAADRSRAQAVDGKRRNASSLASVPSAALTRDPSEVRRYSPQETNAAIADFIRKSGASN